MEEFMREAGRIKAATVISALHRRQMEGFYFDNANQVLNWIKENLPVESSVSWGDSHTLESLGIKDYFRADPQYKVIDREAAGQDIAQRTEIMRRALSCDYYLTSSNAITLNGELVNIDGRGNRCAALCFGPEHVIAVVGINKITADVDSAIKRIRTDACTANALRHNLGTPCGLTGKCGNCTHVDCMCCQILVTRFNKVPGRITVLLVGDILGF